jgi:alkanesulfonate monooxygenase SsuD/methylene tetrahydromethanopterin reductase-like flavin-dependent oxidoreductase (luciferase family)
LVDTARWPSDAFLVLTLGVQTWGTDIAALQRYWAAAEALGYDRVVYGDGLWPWTCDGWTMLGALAAQTRKVRIGPAVTYAVDPSSHHPSWLAKRAATVDHLSNGRLDLRLGIGANDDATRNLWQSHGIPYPSRAERLDRLAEAVVVIRALWKGEPVERHGRFGDLVGAVGGPLPVQRPGPPVWIAAMSERGLTLVARLADGWEASYLPPAGFARRWWQLRRLLAAEHREPESVRRSIEVDVVLGQSEDDAARALGRFCAARGIDERHPLVGTLLAGDATAVQQAAIAYEAAGATDLLLGFADFPETRMLEAFASTVTPALRAH